MKFSSATDRLATLGGHKWSVHELARAMASEDQDIIELTIGEPDVPTPGFLIEEACTAMLGGRTGYSEGRGELKLRRALSERYSQRLGYSVTEGQVLCFPGAQMALYAGIRGIVETGDEVLVGDPMYATYEGVIASSGATMVPVPLHPESGFRLQVKDFGNKITGNTQAILLNTPHNPTGVVSTAEEIRQIGDLAKQHDLWLIVDEVYEELVFGAASFYSPLSFEDLADRVVVVSSISKSWAAPGFRSGWCVASEDFCSRLVPLLETMLFGNQPFIADMTASAVCSHSNIAPAMAIRFEKRSEILIQMLHENTGLKVHKPHAGMFALIDVSSTGLNGYDYAMDLLNRQGVAVMPGSAFGESLVNWVRVALTIDDKNFIQACERMIAHENFRTRVAV